MPNEALSQAIKEAYASAPPVPVLDTIELYHPAFVDDQGQPAPVRYVNDGLDLTAYLEATAPRNPGEEVTFTAGQFRLKVPETTDKGVSDLQIAIDNVNPVITRYIELAMQNPEPIDVIWRPYVSDDLSGPDLDPPLYMQTVKINVDITSVALTASFNEWVNKRYPGFIYTAEDYPGLVR